MRLRAHEKGEPGDDPGRPIPEVRIETHTCRDGRDLSQEVARRVAGEMKRVIGARGLVVLVLDGSPALAECYRRLVEEDLAWTRVVALQLSEWRGKTAEDVGSGRRLLHETLVRRVPMAEFHSLRGEAANPVAVCANYERLIVRRRPDLAVVSTGEDGEVGMPPIFVDGLDVRPGGGRVGFSDDSLGLTLGALLECEVVVAVGKSWPRGADRPGVIHFAST